MFVLLSILQITSTNCESVVRTNLFSAFSAAVFQPDVIACAAVSEADRSVAVRSQAQCLYECQHGGDTTVCVGVNYRQLPNNLCDVYLRCPTNYTHNVPGCQYIQKWNATSQKVCPISVACDGNCTSSCAEQGPRKCDSRCTMNYGLTTDYTCKPCDVKCTSGCAVQGAAKCDTQCINGFGIASDYTCQACATFCTSGCSNTGAWKCDSLCTTGYGIASDHTCQACAAHCADGCSSWGAWKCDSLCTTGYGIASDHTCQDINECLTNNGGCSANAVCTNTVGSFTCTCNPYSNGNGFTCTDVVRLIGCYADNVNARDLDSSSWYSSTMSVEACLDYCKARACRYSGVQAANWCLCGNSYGRYGTTSTCNEACSGNSNENCGGQDTSALYTSGITI